MAVLDGAGATACILNARGRIFRRALYGHGRVLGADTPIYLGEVAMLHAIRALRDWATEFPSGFHSISHIMMCAGAYKLEAAVKRWLTDSTVEMHSAVASISLDEYRAGWVTRPVGLPPFKLVKGGEDWQNMPWVHSEGLRRMEEFRKLTDPEPGES